MGTGHYDGCPECVPGAVISISMSLSERNDGSKEVNCKVGSHKFHVKKNDNILQSDILRVEWAIGVGYDSLLRQAHTTATWIYLAIDGSRTWPIFSEISVLGGYTVEDEINTLSASLRKEQALEPCKHPCVVSFP
jgi:hypothetical protein